MCSWVTYTIVNRSTHSFREISGNKNIFEFGKTCYPVSIFKGGRRIKHKKGEKESIPVVKEGRRIIPVIKEGRRTIPIIKMGRRTIPIIKMGRRTIRVIKMGRRTIPITKGEGELYLWFRRKEKLTFN